jgi:hypothetical protein
MINRGEAVENWREFDVAEPLCDSLVANKFVKPTEV